MKTGSKKTREQRVNKLVDAGWFTKQMSTRDHRVFYLLPTEYMKELMGEHINAMYHQFIKTTCTLLDQSPVGITDHPNPQNTLMFIDFLINYTDDWHHTFNGRLPTAKYWLLLVSCFLDDCSGQCSKISDLCRKTESGSVHTAESRIQDIVTIGLLEKIIDNSDRRGVLLRPTGQMRQALLAHFDRTFTDFIRFMQSANIIS